MTTLALTILFFITAPVFILGLVAVLGCAIADEIEAIRK